MIKDSYVLAYDWDGDDGVRWDLAEPGSVISAMSGGYLLAEAARGTEVTYDLAVDVRIPMPGMLKRRAEKTIIDTALKGLKDRAESLADGGAREAQDATSQVAGSDPIGDFQRWLRARSVRAQHEPGAERQIRSGAGQPAQAGRRVGGRHRRARAPARRRSARGARCAGRARVVRESGPGVELAVAAAGEAVALLVRGREVASSSRARGRDRGGAAPEAGAEQGRAPRGSRRPDAAAARPRASPAARAPAARARPAGAGRSARRGARPSPADGPARRPATRPEAAPGPADGPGDGTRGRTPHEPDDRG